ncbi:MAG: lamin tail domain-containing protein [Candidatus Methanofastidiosia archaeon]
MNTGDSRLDDDYNLNTESVTIWNTGDWGVNMSGWKLYDKSFKRSKTEGHDFYFPTGFLLGPGEMVTIYSGKFDWNLFWKTEEEFEKKGLVYELPRRESAMYFSNVINSDRTSA